MCAWCMSLCVWGRGLTSVCSTNDEVCTMYTLAHNDRLPPVSYYKHRMFRGFLVYMAESHWVNAPLGVCTCSAHADRQTNTLVAGRGYSHIGVACCNHGDESLITHTMCWCNCIFRTSFFVPPSFCASYCMHATIMIIQNVHCMCAYTPCSK